MELGTGTSDTSLARVMVGADQAHGAWERTARQVQLFAGELGIALDLRTLIWTDVRDLMAVRECLRHHLQHPTRLDLRRQKPHPCCARSHALLGGQPA